MIWCVLIDYYSYILEKKLDAHVLVFFVGLGLQEIGSGVLEVIRRSEFLLFGANRPVVHRSNSRYKGCRSKSAKFDFVFVVDDDSG